jgi:hypothetical protein
MDAKSLISLSKAKFAYHSNRIYLKEKYTSKLIIAEQGGMWQITPEFLSFLSVIKNNKTTDMIIMDKNNNPIKVKVSELYDISFSTYESVMDEWYNELQELEKQR